MSAVLRLRKYLAPFVFVIIASVIALIIFTQTSTMPSPVTAAGNIATDPNFKVAFIGDSSLDINFENVLNLVKNEGAQALLHQGDFDYNSDADGFFAKIDSILGPNFPYFSSVGNHDDGSWNTGCTDTDGCYAQFIKDRMARIGVTPDDPNLNDQMYAASYKGLKMVFVGVNGARSKTFAPYINSQLTQDSHIWKICSWHQDQKFMQLGSKSNEMGWAVYENCKNNAAIVATAHEHSYERTKTLTSMQNLTVDTLQHPLVGGIPSNPDSLLVAPGKSFVFVSGLGGNSMRDQGRCLPSTYPYGGGNGCKYIWAKAYTTNQTSGVEKFGALFIIFNYNGDPLKAHGYFKNTDGVIIDEFDITAG